MTRLFPLYIAFLLIIIAGCSFSDDSPVTSSSNQFPEVSYENQDHSLLGMWDVEFDLENLSAKILPKRDLAAHYNITLFLPSPTIQIISFDPTYGVVEVDLTIHNPNAIPARDVRLIVFTDAVGHRLVNADAWTDLYDPPGGLPVNPFKAYMKSDPDRIFPGISDQTETLEIYLPYTNPNVTFAIDATFPGNCVEPYMMENFSQTSLDETAGSSADIQIDVLDWQDDVSSVSLYCPLVTNQQLVPLTFDSGNTWAGIVTNVNGKAHGDYPGYILAYSGGVALYHKVDITVSTGGTAAGWAKSWGGPSYSDTSSDVIVSSTDEIFVCGRFAETVDFDPGNGVTQIDSNGTYDGFLSKFDSNGNFLWVKTWGGDGHEMVVAMAIDDTDCLYITGFYDDEFDADPSPNEFILPLHGFYDAYISKFDSNGNFLWAVSWGGSGMEQPHDIDVAGSNLYVIGNFENSVDFDPTGNVDIKISNGDNDAFLTRLNTSGSYHSTTTWGSSLPDNGLAVCADLNGSVFAGGSFFGTCDFNPGAGTHNESSLGENDAYLLKLDSLNNFQWVRKWGSVFWDNTRSLEIDNEGYILAFANFMGTCDFDPGAGIVEHTADLRNVSLSKFTQSGDFVYAIAMGGANYDHDADITVDNDNNYIVCGWFEDTFDADPGPGIEEYTSIGSDDMFVVKLTSAGEYIWANAWGSSDYDAASAVSFDSENNCYILGQYGGPADFDPGDSVDEHIPVGGYDCALVKVSVDGSW